MGLFLDCFAFEGEPPAREQLVAHLCAQIGGEGGLDSYTVEGRRVTLLCMLEPVTRPYAIAFLIARGGTRIHHHTGAPAPCQLPDYVSKPWHQHSPWMRLGVHVRFHLGLLGTAR